MDRDRKLFQTFSLPTLRFYRWSKPAVSFGRTQGIDSDIERSFLQRGIMVVGRPSGGGMVEHREDLCFSLFWNKETQSIPWNVKESYNAIHTWIAEGLKELGIETTMACQKDADNGWCFTSAVCYDLTLNGKKIVGGAQWREKNKALHQGSIQIALNPETVTALQNQFKKHFNVLLTPHE